MNSDETVLAIDIGSTYLFAMVSNAPESHPLLIRNVLDETRLFASARKSSKDPALMKAFLEETSRYADAVCDFTISRCMDWKVREIAVGTRSIHNPYALRSRSLRENPMLNLSIYLLAALRFRCALAKVDVYLVDETNTSQVDAMAKEPVEAYRRGRRSRTGSIFQSGTGLALHRDVNAAINIGRLIFGDQFVDSVKGLKCLSDPVVVLPQSTEEGIRLVECPEWSLRAPGTETPAPDAGRS
jgi:hypothetical protein